MMRHVETTQSFIEEMAYYMNQPKGTIPDKDLAAKLCLCKVQSTKTFEFCAREAMQIFGGRGYIRGGRGARVERMYRAVKVKQIAGGSEEIMLDFAARHMISKL